MDEVLILYKEDKYKIQMLGPKSEQKKKMGESW